MAKIKHYLGDGVDLIIENDIPYLKAGTAKITLSRRAIIELYERTRAISDTAEAPTPTRTVPLKVVMPNREDFYDNWKRGDRPATKPRKETSLEELI